MPILRFLGLVLVVLGCAACGASAPTAAGEATPVASEADPAPAGAPADVEDGVQRIELREGYSVWTRRIGSGPIKILSLHGGPAATHEYWQSVEKHLPEGVTFYYYDQLGSFHSDQPEDKALWTIERFVGEVEQVRTALGLGPDDFYLLGHSWGGILAMEYALVHQKALAGLIVSNMTADFGKYERYNAKLRAQLPAEILAQLESYESKEAFTDPDYEGLVFEHFYKKHVLRAEDWPKPVLDAFGHINKDVYVYMQGPSEFVPGGILKGWSVWDRLPEIQVPTLTIGAAHDTMNPDEMKQMSELVARGRYLHLPNGSHMAMWDDEDAYWKGVFEFTADVAAGKM